uniref:Uncharacterized protein n=1 Tax=Avena sativa TaxID=4498 RepID=A0ACD5U9P9_AVESA
MTLNDTEHLSLHAMQGTDTDSTIRLPAEINNLAMLMLIDSGSTSSFLDVSMVSKLGLIPHARPPVYVKVDNGDKLLCAQVIPNFTWSTQGHKFTHNMQVLDMGGYDAVLGMDWLQKFRPMNCDWVAKWLEFEHEGGLVKLQGVLHKPQYHIREISMDQVIQLHKNNELWATTVLENSTELSILPAPDSVT